VIFWWFSKLLYTHKQIFSETSEHKLTLKCVNMYFLITKTLFHITSVEFLKPGNSVLSNPQVHIQITSTMPKASFIATMPFQFQDLIQDQVLCLVMSLFLPLIWNNSWSFSVFFDTGIFRVQASQLVKCFQFVLSGIF